MRASESLRHCLLLCAGCKLTCLISQQLICQGRGGQRCKLKVCRPFPQLLALSAMVPTWEQLCLCVLSSLQCLEVPQTPAMLNNIWGLAHVSEKLDLVSPSKHLHYQAYLSSRSQTEQIFRVFLFPSSELNLKKPMWLPKTYFSLIYSKLP